MKGGSPPRAVMRLVKTDSLDVMRFLLLLPHTMQATGTLRPTGGTRDVARTRKESLVAER